MKPRLVIYSVNGDPVATLVTSDGEPVQCWRGEGMRFALEALKPLIILEEVVELIRLDAQPHPYADIVTNGFMKLIAPDPEPLCPTTSPT